jgi:hypothetical protein
VLQAHGLFNSVATYNYPLDSNTVQQIFNGNYGSYMINPFNSAMAQINPAPSSPSTNTNTPDAITGQGNLIFVGSASSCASGTNAYNVWITNVVATLVASNSMNVTFTIEGGSNNVPFDVFVNSVLDFSTNTNKAWTWEGQGCQCTTYLLTNLPPPTCFLILGTPQDSAGAELTDAYQLLVSKTNPTNACSDPDGLLTGWEILLGLNPHISNVTNPSEQSRYSYTPADWLGGVTGARSGTINMDPEGNVTQVSQ